MRAGRTTEREALRGRRRVAAAFVDPWRTMACCWERTTTCCVEPCQGGRRRESGATRKGEGENSAAGRESGLVLSNGRPAEMVEARSRRTKRKGKGDQKALLRVQRIGGKGVRRELGLCCCCGC
ncbi:hypothetical protein AAHE18_03G309300 [Arachis hypogaea]